MPRTIFITYSHQDSEFKERIAEELEYHEELEVVFDERVLDLGDPFTNLFDEIGSADALISILSENSADSEWVATEMDVAIERQIGNQFDFIPIIKDTSDFGTVMEKLDDKYSEFIESHLVGRFDEDYEETFEKLVRKLSPETDPDEVYYTVEGARGENPFRRVRTEYFETDQLLAEFFAKPEPKKYNRVTELNPTLVKGGRGSGKTMALKSLEAKVHTLREGKGNFEEANIDFFGTYCRLSQGSFETQSDEITDHIDIEAASRLFKSEIILRLIESTIDELQEAKEHDLISENITSEANLITEVSTPLQIEKDITTLDDVRNQIARNLNEIRNYVNDSVINNNPDYNGVWLDKENLRDVCTAISDFLPGDENYTIYFLVDEYENLQNFQKTVVNTLIKWSESGYFSFKIASKKPCFNNPQTLEGQELEESHDYNSVDLDYDLKSDMPEYKELIKRITAKIFENEGLGGMDIESVLEDRPRLGDFSEEKIEQEIIELKGEDREWWEDLNEDTRKSYWSKYSMAAFYRLHDGQKRRDFGGLNQLTKLSSGIIRHFLELCGVSYYYALQSSDNPLADGISVDAQTSAAYLLSEYYLDFIGGNVEMHGPKMRRLVLDFGDIFKSKLENHSSEPEAAQINIENPERMARAPELAALLDKAEEHSILQKDSGRGGMKPKTQFDRQPVTYTLNRIFTPALEISPNYRWRTSFKVEDLERLIDEDERQEVRNELIAKASQQTHDDAQRRFSEYND